MSLTRAQRVDAAVCLEFKQETLVSPGERALSRSNRRPRPEEARGLVMWTPHGCSNGVGAGAPLLGAGTRPSQAGAPGGHSCPSPAFQPPEEPDEEAGAAEARRKREDGGMAEWSTGTLLCPVFGVLLVGSFVEVAQSSFQRPWTSVVPSRRVPHRRATCLS